MRETKLRAMGNSMVLLIPKSVRELLTWTPGTRLSMKAYGKPLSYDLTDALASEEEKAPGRRKSNCHLRGENPAADGAGETEAK